MTDIRTGKVTSLSPPQVRVDGIESTTPLTGWLVDPTPLYGQRVAILVRPVPGKASSDLWLLGPDRAGTSWLTDFDWHNGFSAYSAGDWPGLRYRLVGGVVYIQGAFQRSGGWTGESICTIPAGFRPSASVRGGGVQLGSDGILVPRDASTSAADVANISYPLG